MTLRLEDKQHVVAQVKAVAQSALSAVVADYRGVTVEDMTVLRKKARQQSVYLHVVRNTLLRKAVAGTDYECLLDTFVGPTIIAFATEEPGASARLLKSFSKEHDAFDIKGLAINGQALAADKIDVLATLPTRHEAMTQLVVLTMSVITTLARTLNDIPSQVVRVTQAVGSQK